MSKKIIQRLSFLIIMIMALCACSMDPAKSGFDKAEELLGSGNYAGALQKYSEVVRKYNRSPYAAQSQYKIAFIWGRMGDGKKAAEAYAALFYLYPGTPEARAGRQDLAAYYSRSGEHKKAIEEYQKLLAEAPSQRQQFQYLMALEYVELNDMNQARIELQELIRVSARAFRPEVQFQIANTYYIEGNLRLAIKSFDAVVSEYPESPVALEALFSKARALEEAGGLVEAREIYKGLLDRYPDKEAIKKHMDWIDGRLSQEPAS